MSQLREICPTCKRTKRSSEKGSLTGFMFETLYCRCGAEDGAASLKPSKIDYCPNCGLMLPESERVGSFTSYLFQDIRCACSKESREQAHQNIERLGLRTRYRMSQDSKSKSSALRTAMRSRRVVNCIDSIELVGLTSGEVIGNSYQLEELIGEGGMGLVFRAKHLQLGRTCAIKILAPTMISQASWDMFQNEARILAGLKHECLVEIYDFGVHKQKLPFYAMDYLQGETLEDVLLRQGTLSVGAVIEIFIKLAEVVAYASAKGVIHKDIKPANIMLLPPTASGISVKLLDFGIAELTMSNEDKDPDVIGTAAYMSPERFFGGVLDHRLDIYSLGCAMFETLTGSLPYQSDEFNSLIKQHALDPIPLMRARTGVSFPIEVEAVVRKCIGKTPDDRYQNAAYLSVDLGAILNGEPLQFANDLLEVIKKESVEANVSTVPSKSKMVWPPVFLIVLICSVTIAVLTAVNAEHRNSTQKTETSRPEVEQPGDLVSNNIDKIDKVVTKVTDDGVEIGPKVWLLEFEHHRLGTCRAIVESTKAKLFGQKGKESIAHRAGDDYAVVEVHNGGGNVKINDKLKQYNRKSEGFKLKEEGTEKVLGLNCIRYELVTRRGERALYWTTRDIKTTEPIARGFALSCDLPGGYGMPVRLMYLGGKSKPSKTVFELTKAEHMSKSMATLHRKVGEQKDFDESNAAVENATEKREDGAVATRTIDGSIETVWPNGTVRVEDPGGTGFIKSKDGTIEHFGPDRADCYVQTVSKNGLKTTRYKDGTVLVENPDLSLTYKYSNGTSQNWRPTSNIGDPGVYLDVQDVTWSRTTTYPNGERKVELTKAEHPPLLSSHELLVIANKCKLRN